MKYFVATPGAVMAQAQLIGTSTRPTARLEKLPAPNATAASLTHKQMRNNHLCATTAGCEPDTELAVGSPPEPSRPRSPVHVAIAAGRADGAEECP